MVSARDPSDESDVMPGLRPGTTWGSTRGDAEGAKRPGGPPSFMSEGTWVPGDASAFFLVDALGDPFSLVEAVPDPRGGTPGWRLLRVNPAWVRCLGAGQGTTLLQACPELDPAVPEGLQRVASGSGPEVVEARVAGRWFEFRLSSPGPGQACCLLTDCTERRLREEALQDRENLYRTAWASLPVGAGVTEAATGAFLSINAGFTEVFGYTLEELQGGTSVTAGIWANPADRLEVMARIGRDGWVRALPTPIRRKDGALRWVAYSGHAVTIRGKACVLSAAVDITEQKRFESELEQAKAGLSALVESTVDLIWSVDLEHRLLNFNSSLADHFLKNYGTRPRLGGTSRDWLPPDRADRWGPLYDRALAEGPYQVEYALSDGRTLELAFNLIRRDGDPVGISVFGKDITSRRKAEEALHHTQKLEALGQLAGGVAHDFNNLLAAILGAADLLADPEGRLEAPRRQALLGMITTSARRAGDLTSKLLSFSRKRRRDAAAVDLGAVLRDAVEILGRTLDKAITVVLDDQALDTRVDGDDSMLESVFMNLGINASHAMPGGGVLAFQVRNVDLSEAFCAASPFALSPGRFVAIEVRDTGCGMTRAVQSRIFEPFFTTKPQGKGTGLGLSAAYGAILDHHGAIEVESAVGAGTTFRILLPAASTQPAALEEEASAVAGTGSILVIDDEEMLREILRSMLEDLGYQVRTASDGQEGLALFKAHHGELGLVILDMIMPVMGGRQAFELMREWDGSVPIVLSSGYSRGEDLEALQAMGLDQFIQKPFSMADLSRVVAATIRRK